MFEKTLTDIVKGIRASKRDTALYISQCIKEIKAEINSSDMFVKANALQKLTFLQMMGYSMSWASFASIEVMSSPRFAHKRIGYLAASQGFTQDTEVILLTTNLLKKELRGAVGGGMHGVYEAGLAINCISNIITSDLAVDLLPELTNLTMHPQPYLRKKAILCLFKLFVKYPQGLRLTFAKIQQCLEDAHPSVVSCAVNVITELADKNPKNYLHLAPAFFQLLTSSSNNWMLIKVVKLLGSLVPEEPRLARKLLEPLAKIVRETQAKSLLYEAVYTITLCLPYCRKTDGSMPPIVPEIVALCAMTLKDLVGQADQNLKYLGLVGFGSLMQSHPRVLSAPDYRPMILACLSDQDVTIRSRALELLTGMASRKNLIELVTQLLKHVEFATGSYKNDLVAKIVAICASEKYALIQDFEWYVDVLFQIAHVQGVEKHAQMLRNQITDVGLRVLPVRPYAVRRSIEVLLEREGKTSKDATGDNGRGRNVMPDILPAIAFIVGEYSDLIPEALVLETDHNGSTLLFDSESTGTYHSVIQVLTNPLNTQKLQDDTLKVFLQTSMKVIAAASTNAKLSDKELEACIGSIHRCLPVYMQNTNVEVVERSFSAMELLKSLNLVVFPEDDALSGLASEDDTNGAGEADLLSMDKKTVKKTSDSVKRSLVSQLRSASGALTYLLKPLPMKPTGAKAQRKKWSSLADFVTDSPDFGFLDQIIAEAEAYRSNSRLTMEAISFTQQRLLQSEEANPVEIAATGNHGAMNSVDPSSSFQKSSALVVDRPVTRQRDGDPFYLDATKAVAHDGENAGLTRLSTIQLLSSDEEDQEAKRKKKKKSKRGNSHAARANTPHNAVAVFDSDEEDDGSPVVSGRPKKRDAEFKGLAKVDLTMPLREDEVMPVRQHRVVPERPVDPIVKAGKKKARPKKGKSRKSLDIGIENSVGDLLDLGAFSQMPISSDSNPPLASVRSPLQSNPISTAFDDLLGISFTGNSSNVGPSTVNGRGEYVEPSLGVINQVWSKASISPPVAPLNSDLSLLRVFFRATLVTRNGYSSALVVVRVDNLSAVPQKLAIELKPCINVDLGVVPPGGSKESEEIGPFSYPNIGASRDVKGTLTANEGSVRVKLALPVSLHLSPEERLSLDDVAEEFAVPSEWSSHSAKIQLPIGLATTNLKQMLKSFLRAAVVQEAQESDEAATFAACSSRGERVRILVKVKGSQARVDVRVTSEMLGKALCSDLKKLDVQ